MSVGYGSGDDLAHRLPCETRAVIGVAAARDHAPLPNCVLLGGVIFLGLHHVNKHFCPREDPGGCPNYKHQ